MIELIYWIIRLTNAKYPPEGTTVAFTPVSYVETTTTPQTFSRLKTKSGIYRNSPMSSALCYSLAGIRFWWT